MQRKISGSIIFIFILILFPLLSSCGSKELSLEEIKQKMSTPSSERIFMMYEALRKGVSVDEMHDLTRIGKWFINEMKDLVDHEEAILKYKFEDLPEKDLTKSKEWGFSDKYLAKIFDVPEKNIRKKRLSFGIIARYEAVPVSGVENAAYYYSTYKQITDEVPDIRCFCRKHRRQGCRRRAYRDVFTAFSGRNAWYQGQSR